MNAQDLELCYFKKEVFERVYPSKTHQLFCVTIPIVPGNLLIELYLLNSN